MEVVFFIVPERYRDIVVPRSGNSTSKSDRVKCLFSRYEKTSFSFVLLSLGMMMGMKD